MSYDSVMAFLRNPYVVSDENTLGGDILCEDLDRLDNYLLAGGIERINRWKHPWVMPYDNACLLYTSYQIILDVLQTAVRKLQVFMKKLRRAENRSQRWQQESCRIV